MGMSSINIQEVRMAMDKKIIQQVQNVKYEGSSKSFRTFIFSQETVRVGGVVIGRVWECHVTSQLGKLADLAG